MSNSEIQGGKRLGMQTMDDALEALVQEQAILGQDAYLNAQDKHRFEEYASSD